MLLSAEENIYFQFFFYFFGLFDFYENVLREEFGDNLWTIFHKQITFEVIRELLHIFSIKNRKKLNKFFENIFNDICFCKINNNESFMIWKYIFISRMFTSFTSHWWLCMYHWFCKRNTHICCVPWSKEEHRNKSAQVRQIKR